MSIRLKHFNLLAAASIVLISSIFISCSQNKSVSIPTASFSQDLPFGLNFGMSKTDVEAIVDSLTVQGYIIDDDELGHLLCLPHERRIRLLFGYDEDKGLSEIELTTNPIYGEFREATKKDVENILKAQKINLSDKRWNEDSSISEHSRFYHCDSIRIHTYFNGHVSIGFKHAKWNSDLNERIEGRIYYGNYGSPASHDIPTVYLIFGIILAAALVVALIMTLIINNKEKKGYPHDPENIVRGICIGIAVLIGISLVLSAIMDSLIGIVVFILCAIAFTPEAFKRK